MPNWCENNLYLRHTDTAMIKRAVQAFDQGKFLSEFYPEPDYTTTEVRPTFPGIVGNNDPVDPKHAWWDWRVQHWGTKWDIGLEQGCTNPNPYKEGDTSTFLYFNSAWSPPTAAMDKLAELGFEFDLYYMEPGMEFCGYHSHEGEDSSYVLPQNKDDLKNIPAFIVDELGLDFYLESYLEMESDE